MVFSFSTLGLSLYEKDRGRQEKEKKKTNFLNKKIDIYINKHKTMKFSILL